MKIILKSFFIFLYLISLSSSLSSNSFHCNQFFSILSEINPWKNYIPSYSSSISSHSIDFNSYSSSFSSSSSSYSSSYSNYEVTEPCEDTFIRLDLSFRLLSNQMKEMNQTLFIFTSYNLNSNCQINYSNIQFIKFNPIDLLQEYSLTSIIPILNSYYYDDYSKVSDILRLLIAEKYNFTYIDLDIHFLNYNVSLYFTEFIAMHIWNYDKCTLEITNAAFCLSPYILQKLRQQLVHQIITRDIYKYHTELGPTLFAKVLTNLNYPIYYYTVNHPESFNVSYVVSDIRIYNHHLLHLTSSLRMLLQDSQTISFEQFIDQVRSQLNLKPITLPPSVITEESMFKAMKAMFTLHPTHHNHFQLGLDIVEVLIERHRKHCDDGLKLENELNDEYFECVVILGEIIGSSTVSQSIYQTAKQLTLKLDSLTCTNLADD